IVEINRVRESSELADAIETLGEVDPNDGTVTLPKAVTLTQIADAVKADAGQGNLFDWITDRRNSRMVPHRMGESGYTPVRHKTRKDGTSPMAQKRHVTYPTAALTPH